MSEQLCAVCVEKVESGTDESKWGFDFGSLGSLWFHYRCADDLADASRRIRGQPEYAALRKRVEGLEEAMEKIVQWAEAYPLDVFPEPDFKKVAKVLKDAGMTLDAISASNMRHVVEGVGKIAKSALAEEDS